MHMSKLYKIKCCYWNAFGESVSLYKGSLATLFFPFSESYTISIGLLIKIILFSFNLMQDDWKVLLTINYSNLFSLNHFFPQLNLFLSNKN